MSEPLTKVQKVDSTKTAKSYDFTYKYEDSNHPTTPTQIGHEYYTYDANGNLVLVENDSLNTERRMYWDEDNRLMILSDKGKTSRYTYNAGGERIIKSHGDLEGVYVNGAPQGITFHEMEDYTIYPAPIITVTKNRFTKHYFIGDLGDHSVPEGWVQRPKFNAKGDVPGPPVQWQKPEAPDNAQPGYGFIPTDTANVKDIFFYNSDHLGSTSYYITDAKANITQFDAYLPYGELLVDEHSSSEEMPYKFNGKELDQETGLYYYGARYMNTVTRLWYGVDALAEKYIQTSAYIYGGGNPIRIIDPNGMGWVETEDKKAYWDERVNSAEDTKFIPKGGRFLGSTADLFDEHGEYKFGDDQGNILSAHPLENVIVTGDKEYNFHQTFGYKIFGDFRDSDGGLGPWNPDAVSFDINVSGSFLGFGFSANVGLIVGCGRISPFASFSSFAGFSTDNFKNLLFHLVRD